MRQISKEIVKECFRKQTGAHDDSLYFTLIDLFSEWYECDLPEPVFYGLVVVATPVALIQRAKQCGWDRLVLPMARALLDSPDYACWGAPHIREKSKKYGHGQPFSKRMIVHERFSGEPASGSLTILDGNHDAIAYAMALSEHDTPYVPVPAYVGSGFDPDRVRSNHAYARHRAAPGCRSWMSAFEHAT